MAHGRPRQVAIPLVKLQGVRSVDDLGPWHVIDAVATAGSQAGKVFRRERVYGLRHPTAGIRYACGPCGETYPTVAGADRHRQKTHPTRHGGPRQTLEVARQDVAEPRQMTFDEVGLDTIGPAIAEGVAAIVASRQGLRERMAGLEAENTALREALTRIVETATQTLERFGK